MEKAKLNLTYKCPCCGEYFHPKRLNQVYYQTDHGWIHRNSLKSNINIEEVELQLSVLNNLKILNKFSFSSCLFLDRKKLSSLNLDSKGFKVIKVPAKELDPHPDAKWFEICGYVVQLFQNGNCILYKPSFYGI